MFAKSKRPANDATSSQLDDRQKARNEVRDVFEQFFEVDSHLAATRLDSANAQKSLRATMDRFRQTLLDFPDCGMEDLDDIKKVSVFLFMLYRSPS